MSTPPPLQCRKWSDSERGKVMGMLDDGASCGAVAAVFGISRNAAVGRIARDPELQARMSKRHRRPANPWWCKSHRAKPGPKPKPVSPAGDSDSELPADFHPMPLIGTGNRFCKWPVAMAKDMLVGIVCCGAMSLPGDVYCSFHRHLSNGERQA